MFLEMTTPSKLKRNFEEEFLLHFTKWRRSTRQLRGGGMRPKSATAAAPLQAPAKPRTFPLFVLPKFNSPTVDSGVQQLPEVPPEK